MYICSMKKLFLFLLISAVIYFPACDNDFDLIDNWIEIPVVYGLLDKADTAHYVRVEKAFLDPETDAFQIAQIPDSIYYQNVSLELEEVTPGGTTNTYALDLVDGALEGYPRDEGIFAQNPNYLYKTKIPLNSENTYRIAINNDDTGNSIKASTPIIEDITIFTPPAPTVSTTFRLWNNLLPIRFSWSKDINASIFDLVVTINYLEKDGNGVVTPKSILWTVAKNLEVLDDNSVSVEDVPYETMLQIMANNIPADGKCRQFIDLDIEVVAGGEELRRYLEVNSANIGITGSIPLNTYSNIPEGRGIFSTRTSERIEGIQITGELIDIMEEGETLAGRNFIGAGGTCP